MCIVYSKKGQNKVRKITGNNTFLTIKNYKEMQFHSLFEINSNTNSNAETSQLVFHAN